MAGELLSLLSWSSSNLGQSNDVLTVSRKDRIEVWDGAQKPILEWAVKRVKENPNITKIVPVGGLWKNWYMQQKFKHLINEDVDKVHEVVPMSQLWASHSSSTLHH